MMTGCPFSKPVSDRSWNSRRVVKGDGDRFVAPSDADVVELFEIEHFAKFPIAQPHCSRRTDDS